MKWPFRSTELAFHVQRLFRPLLHFFHFSVILDKCSQFRVSKPNIFLQEGKVIGQAFDLSLSHSKFSSLQTYHFAVRHINNNKKRYFCDLGVSDKKKTMKHSSRYAVFPQIFLQFHIFFPTRLHLRMAAVFPS